MGGLGSNSRQAQALQITQASPQTFCRALATGHKGRQLHQLLAGNGCFNFAKPEVMAQDIGQFSRVIAINHGFAVITDQTQAIGQTVVVRDQQATLAAMNMFVIVEAEAADISAGSR